MLTASTQSTLAHEYDVAVIGAGSGGVATALSAARTGLRVTLIERGGEIGGNAVWGGVHCWEPGVGGTGIPFDIYSRLQGDPQVVGIYSFGRHCCWPNHEGFPGGEMRIDRRRTYADTLRRHGARSLAENEAFFREHIHGVVFEPAPYVAALRDLLAETGRCEVRCDTSLVDVESRDGWVHSARLSDGSVLRARFFVDATAEVVLCQAAGCETVLGEEARSTYGEPSAPPEPTRRINGVTLIYRVTRAPKPQVQPLPPDIPEACWWRDGFPVASCFQYPCGDFNINMLPTMEGDEFLDLGYGAAYAECRKRVLAHWRHCQVIFPEFREYMLAPEGELGRDRSWIAPRLGVRESRRVVTDYVLSEHNLSAGLDRQRHRDIIAIADHPMDTHGRGGGCGEVAQPYGVPSRCLIPRGYRNLLVACRGAGFSSLAASSCRLTRTMMQLGQAAGTAVALAKRGKRSLPAIKADALRSALRKQGVQLT